MRRVLLLACLALVATVGRVDAATTKGSASSGRVQTLTGVKSGPYLGTPEVAARAALKDMAARLPKLTTVDTLKVDKIFEYSNGLGSTIRFSQVHAGYPVLDATAIVRLGGDGRVLRVSSSLQSLIDVPLQAKIAQPEAIRLARSSVKFAVPTKQNDGARLVIANGRLAWDVYVKTLDPTHAITVTLDAATGEYMFQREHAKSLKQANIFNTSKEVKNARKANGSFDTSKLSQISLPGLVGPAAGLSLNSDVKSASNYSTDIVAYNCCPTLNCDGTTAPPKISGTFNYGTTSIPYDTVLCDEKPLPISDTNGDFYFTPPQEPTKATPMGSAADGDPFAVVMAYNHATEQLAYMRKLDPKFTLGENAHPLRVTANYLQPDFDSAFSGGFGGGKIDVKNLVRYDNSQFAPAGMLEQLYGMTTPEYKRDFDSVMLYQGTTADFAYDAQVVAHEFTHGVVEATANLQDYNFDDWGVTIAPGAMNEGFADYWAAARFNDPFIGEYVGDISGGNEGSLRNLENDYTCPSVLSGEVHWDSQHFSAAIWGARKAIGTTAAKLLTFDAAVLRAMPTIDPLSSYENAAISIVLEIESGMGAEARDLAAQSFTARGFGAFSFNDDGSTDIAGCERAVDVSVESPFVPINSDLGMSLPPEGRFVPYAPAPIQFRITPPAGANKVTFKLTATDGRSFPLTRGLFKPDGHVSFSTASSDLRDDAEVAKNFSQQKFAADLEAGCGDRTYYLAIANVSQNTSYVQGLTVAYEFDDAKKAECEAATNPDPGSGGDTAKVKTGCQSTSAGLFAIVGLAVAALARRRRNAAN